MFVGNLGIQYFFTYPGSPVGVSVYSFDAPAGSYVVDTKNDCGWLKTSPRGDNSGFLKIHGALNSPIVVQDTVTGSYYSVTINGGQIRLVPVATPTPPPNFAIEQAATVNDTATGLPAALYIQGGELKVTTLPSPATAMPILYDIDTGTEYLITVSGGEIRLVQQPPATV